MRTLATDISWREALASAGHAYWLANHTIELTAARYRDVIHEAAARPAPVCTDLPRHFTEDYTELTRRIADHFGISDAVPFLRGFAGAGRAGASGPSNSGWSRRWSAGHVVQTVSALRP